MQFVSFLRQHIKKRKWSERDDSLHRKTLCFQSKKIRSVVCWFISICVIRLRAVTVNGWTSRGTNRWHGPSVGGEAVSLSINDIICPADVFLCSLLSLWWHLTWKKRGRKGEKKYFPLGLSGRTLESETLGTVCPSAETETSKCSDRCVQTTDNKHTEPSVTRTDYNKRSMSVTAVGLNLTMTPEQLKTTRTETIKTLKVTPEIKVQKYKIQPICFMFLSGPIEILIISHQGDDTQYIKDILKKYNRHIVSSSAV